MNAVDTPRRSRATRAGTFTALLALGASCLAMPAVATPTTSHALAPTSVVTADDDAKLAWSVLPSPLDGGEDDRSSFFLDAEPGQVLKDSVRIRNHGSEELRLKIYATDARTTEAGVLDLLPAADTPRDVGAWIETARPEVVVGPGKMVDVPFTMRVPADAESGDHTGGIVTSFATPSSDIGSDRSVLVDHRFASRVAVRVAGDLNPQLTISDVTAGYKGTLNPAGRGSSDISYRLANTGNVRLSAQQLVKVKSPFGLITRNATLDPIPELLPGFSMIVTTSVSGVWPTVRSSVNLEVRPIPTRPGDSFPALKSARASSSGWAVPWAFLLFLLALGAGTGGALTTRIRLKERQQQRIDAAVAAKLEEQAEPSAAFASYPNVGPSRPDGSV